MPLTAILSAALAVSSCSSGTVSPQTQSTPWTIRSEGWRSDPAWNDGLAEVAVYEATRTIYGKQRSYSASSYTNAQHMDPARGVKANGSAAESVGVFKHHWSERIPTENYDYDFSTAVFLRTADLALFRLTVGTQEDCGTSFKRLWRSGRKGRDLEWFESVYFPGAGEQSGRLTAKGVVLYNSLPLLLRDFPFPDSDGAANVPQSFPLALISDQTSTRRVDWKPRPHRITYAGRQNLDLPIGQVDAHRLDLLAGSAPTSTDAPGPVASYWFAADGSAPMLRALVRYEGPNGAILRLKSHRRHAYWER